MAKIDNGPLVSNISGSIGELTFQRGLSGQIVRGKPWPPYPGSPAQQLSIDRFRKAMKAWSEPGTVLHKYIAQRSRARGRTPHGPWVEAFYRLLKSGIWHIAITFDRPFTIEILTIEWSPTHVYFTTTLDGVPPGYNATMMAVKDGIMPYMWQCRTSNPLPPGGYGAWRYGLDPPCTFIFWPRTNEPGSPYGIPSPAFQAN